MSLDNNPWDDLNSPVDPTGPKLDINAREKKLYASGQAIGGRGFDKTEIAIGTRIAVDFGTILIGREQFQPQYRCVFVPLGSPLPSAPAEENWTPAIRIQVWVEGYSLRLLRVRGKIHLMRFKSLFQLFGHRPDAQDNKIPVYKFCGFEAVPTDFGVFGGIILELIDFIDRDEEFFGPRITPPPPPLLSTGPRIVALPPAEAPEAPEQQIQPVEPANTAPAPQSERTPFSSFRPITPTSAPSASSNATPSPTLASGKKPGAARKPY
jgi:hypothetical protein